MNFQEDVSMLEKSLLMVWGFCRNKQIRRAMNFQTGFRVKMTEIRRNSFDILPF